MDGRMRCDVLRNIRRDIARCNEIPLNTPECTHVGDCPGTCPMCESELKYLEASLKKREREGKPIQLDGACVDFEAVRRALTEASIEGIPTNGGERPVELDGYIMCPEEPSW